MKKRIKNIVIPLLISVLVTCILFVVADIFRIPSSISGWNSNGTPSIIISEKNPRDISIGSQDACAAEYTPVCGTITVQCIKAPCLPVHQTFSNSCEAARAGAKVLSVGTCESGSMGTGMTTEKGNMTGETLSDVESTGTMILIPKSNTGSIKTASGISEQKEPTTPLIMGGTSSATGAINFDTGSYHLYTNNTFHYSLALPKYTYYQGYASSNGANHVLAIALTATGTENINTSDVRVYFFKELPTEFPGDHDTVTLTLSGGYLVVEGDSAQPKVAKIIDTIRQSAK